MTTSLGIRTQDHRILVSLLKEHLPEGTTVWAFGSRIRGTSRPNSDLDLVVFTTPESRSTVSTLREALDESNIPFRVDLHVWSDLPESFHAQIEQDHVELAIITGDD